MKLVVGLATLVFALVALSVFALGQSPPGQSSIKPDETHVLEPQELPLGVADLPQRSPSGAERLVGAPPAGGLLSPDERAHLKQIAKDVTLPGTDLSARGIGASASARQGKVRVKIRQRRVGLTQATAVHHVGSATAHFLPPDTTVAVGPEHVLQGTNGAFALTNRETDETIIQSHHDHWGIPFSPNFYDPRVLYDAQSERFFMLAAIQYTSPQGSDLHLSVSRGSSPRDLDKGWCRYRIDALREGAWADYPAMASSPALLTVSTNHYAFGGGYRGSYLWVIDKARLADNADACPSPGLSVFETPRDPLGGNPFTMMPAQHRGGIGGEQLLASAGCCASSTRYTIWRLFDRNAGTRKKADVVLDRVSLQGSAFSTQPDAPQPTQPTYGTGNQRITSAVAHGDSLYAVHSLACAQGGGSAESCVRLIDVDMSGGLAAASLSEETFGAGDGRHIFWPAVEVTASGHLAVVFQMAGIGTPLSTAWTSRPVGAGSFSRVRFLRRGDRELDCRIGSVNRTGDYTDAHIDPANPETILIGGEVAATGVSTPQGCNWSTWLGKIVFRGR